MSYTSLNKTATEAENIKCHTHVSPSVLDIHMHYYEASVSEAVRLVEFMYLLAWVCIHSKMF